MTDRALTLSDNYPRLSEVQEAILRRIVEGDSVNSICKADDMPTKGTVFRWLNESDDFRTGYHLAKALYAETLFEEALEIADAAPPMIVTQMADNVTEIRVDNGAVQHAKLRIDTRKWACGKLNPRRFGESSTLNLNDARSEGRPRTKEERFARLAAIAATLAEKQEED